MALDGFNKNGQYLLQKVLGAFSRVIFYHQNVLIFC